MDIKYRMAAVVRRARAGDIKRWSTKARRRFSMDPAGDSYDRQRDRVIYCAIDKERDRQDREYCWRGYSELRRLAVLAEELGEVARAVQRNDAENLTTELVQLAAAAIRWLETPLTLETGSEDK